MHAVFNTVGHVRKYHFNFNVHWKYLILYSEKVFNILTITCPYVHSVTINKLFYSGEFT